MLVPTLVPIMGTTAGTRHFPFLVSRYAPVAAATLRNVLEPSNKGLPRIVVVADHYLPGWKAGGPIRSLSSLVAELSDDFDFLVVTRDRDRADLEPYEGVRLDTWVPVGRVSVFYGRPATLSRRRLYGIIAAAEPDLVYLNSVYSRLTRG